jgi:hypothetical protein
MTPIPAPVSASKPTRTAQDKLRILVAFEAAPPEEKGALLRREGVLEAELIQWRELLTAALEDPPARGGGGDSEPRKRLRELERQLARKDKALAEAAALLLLQKKVQALWGDEDDDTLRRSGP